MATREHGIVAAHELQQGVLASLAQAKALPKLFERGTQQWLDVVARSGTSLFVAPAPAAMNEEAHHAMQEAFTLVQQSRGGYPQEPTTSLVPNAWQFEAPRTNRVYDWAGEEGASPFPV